MAEIVITQPDGVQKEVALEKGRRYSIGRSQTNDIVVRDLSLSRRHAEVFFGEDRWMISDCGSSNGTFINGRRVEAPEPLDPGSEAKFGGCVLVLKGGPGGGSQRAESVIYSDGPVAIQGTITLSAMDMGLDSGLRETVHQDSGAAKALELLRRRLSVIEKANLDLLAHEPMTILLPKVLDLVFEAVRPSRAALLRREDGELLCRAMRGDWGEGVSISRTIAGMVLDKKVSVLTADAQSDLRFAEAQSVAIQGIRSVMAVPLCSDKEAIGLIYADSFQATRTFTDEDLKVLTMLANVAAIQIENSILFDEQVEKRRLIKEAVAAAKIQQGLLPGTPAPIERYSFLGHNVPCYEVGGDYYDCVEVADGHRAIVIGDVAGKGMGAALLMAVLQATFHAHAETAPGPRRFVGHLNKAISRSAPSNRFVTLFYADLDPASNRLTCVNAGHAPLPVMVRASGDVEEVASGGFPLGVFDDVEYKTTEIEMEPGDFLFACSDGVTDVMSPDGEMFGDERLREFLTSSAGCDVEEFHRNLDERLKSFAQGTPQPDDLTVVALQRRE